MLHMQQFRTVNVTLSCFNYLRQNQLIPENTVFLSVQSALGHEKARQTDRQDADDQCLVLLRTEIF